MSDATVTAALQLEEEIRRMLAGFGAEHAVLIRTACRVAASTTDLSPVVVTTVYGHVLVELAKLFGRAHVERMTETLLDLDAASRRAREGESEGKPVSAPPKEAMH